jgi:quercetin 2,3-dioxygenase
VSDLDPAPVVVDLADGPPAEPPVTEQIVPRRAPIGPDTYVARYLPTRARRTVGAWCFLDYFGPDDVAAGPGMQVRAHPHIGLQTATWLLAGEVLHRDSLGSEQTLRPGELNLMTAGSGIAHAEESPVPHPPWIHGLQLWIALPDAHRQIGAAFDHHPDLPEAELGTLRAKVLVGEVAGARSDAAVFSPLVGAEVLAPTADRSAVPLEPGFEHALVVVEGAVVVEGVRLVEGACVYLGRSRRHLAVSGDPAGRFLLLGGEPFSEPLVMWWNFVGRTATEVVEARADWEAGRRFGEVAGHPGVRTPAPPLPPGRLQPRR